MAKRFFVYITASKRNGTLYTGVTSDLPGRAWQHKNKVMDGFTSKYGVDQLVYFEAHDHAETAIVRERQIKKWRREKKVALFAKTNPRWEDLSKQLSGSYKDVLM